MSKDHGARLSDVLVEQDRRVSSTEQAGKRILPLKQWMCSEICSIKLDEIEGVEYCHAVSMAQFIEARQPIRADHGCLAVNREAIGFESLRSGGDRWEPTGPIMAVAREQTHLVAVLADDHGAVKPPSSCGMLPAMTRKPSPKSDESKKSKREAGREVKTEQRTKALKTTLKKAADKDPPKEPEGRED